MTYNICVDYIYIEHIDETDYPDITFHFTGEVNIVNTATDIKCYGIYDFNTGSNVFVLPKKGKLYKNDVLIYEGKFTENGEYTGKCVLYHENGNKQYEGTMLKHRYSGFGKEYDENGDMVYEGDWVDGLQYGQGDQYENNIMIYSGYWYHGSKTGMGQDYSSSSRIYDGEWKDNMWHGAGTHYCEDGMIIETTWNRGQKNGMGSIEMPNGNFMINCEWKNDILLRPGEEVVPFYKLRKTRNKYTQTA